MYIQVNAGYFVLGSKGVAKKFGIDGKLMEDVSHAYSYTMQRSVPCEVISVLASPDSFEVAFFTDDDTMKRYRSTTLKTGSDACMALMRAGGFLRMFTNNGTQEGVKYTQMIFVYKGVCNLNFERILGLTEVKE